MRFLIKALTRDYSITVGIGLSFLLSLTILRSIAPSIFPLYFVFWAAAIIIYIVLSNIDFEITMAFSVVLFIVSIFLLILPIIFGQVTRGVVRWIPLGPVSLQPAEIVRPFLILFCAYFVTSKPLGLKRFLLIVPLLLLPLVLIFLQPSLGVTALTAVGFLGAGLHAKFDKKWLVVGGVLMVLVSPLLWSVMEPYQKARIQSIISLESDPSGAGYNSIQSMIAVGSGKITGRGLGQGVQTQLSFLPERHTDFVFASISEEMGFIGSTLTILLSFFLLSRLINLRTKTNNKTKKAFITGIFASLLLQTSVHIGMNMGLFPITGLPLPLISYGGSSLLSTMLMYALAVSRG